MKRQMLLAGFAAALWVSVAAAAAPTTVFTAVIKGRYRQALQDAIGVANFRADENGIRYTVAITGMKQVTNIILLVEHKAINLYGGPTTTRGNLDASGVLTANDLGGLSLDEMVRDMDSGKAEVTVFTVKLADGSINGRVARAPEDLPEPEPKPEPKVTAATS